MKSCHLILHGKRTSSRASFFLNPCLCNNIKQLILSYFVSAFRKFHSRYESVTTSSSCQNYFPSDHDKNNSSTSTSFSNTYSLSNGNHHCYNTTAGTEHRHISRHKLHSNADYQTRGGCGLNSNCSHDEHPGSRSISKSCHVETTHSPRKHVKKSYDASNNRRNSGQHETNQKRTRSVSDVVEPLNAQRLKPIRQKTRNVVVSITENNEVCLEFLQQKDNQDYVLEVVRISCNGMKITAYIPSGKRGVLLSCSPPPLPANTRAVSNYLYCSLPFKYWKKYQYASRFVDLVRKKTPKITLYTKLAKCMLMENSPSADFEACFYDGM